MGECRKQGLARVRGGNEVLLREMFFISSPVSTLFCSSQPRVALLQETFLLPQGLVNKYRPFRATELSGEALL